MTASAPSFLPSSYIGQVIVELSAFSILSPSATGPDGETKYLKLTSGKASINLAIFATASLYFLISSKRKKLLIADPLSSH